MAQSPDANLDLTLDAVRELTAKDEECTTDVIRIAPVWPVAGNSGVVITDEGIVVVDTGIPAGGPDRVRRIRERSDAPFHTIIYTHGHGDHAGGAGAFLEDAEKRGHPKPRIIGHELVAKRFDKYQMLQGRRQYISSLQFPQRPDSVPRPQRQSERPVQYYYPDTTYSNTMEFKLGGLTFELYHAMGETEDATWVWVPERKTAIIGDLFIGGCPNTGNPLKEQRYTLEWAEALELIASKNPDFIIAGAGPVIRGRLVQEVCLDTAKFLRYVQNEVVRLLNEKYWIEDILEQVRVPDDLVNKPWLAPTYGHPVFVVHDVYRRYTGWYDGNPSELFPSKSSEVAAEVTRLSGIDNLMDRARQLQQEGNGQLALHLLDFAIKGTDDSSRRKEALLLKSEILHDKANAEPSLIARHILRSGAVIVKEEGDSL
jgi:alkyl sulfatase BDS1-like metallo-beta-lactamase superfamily hydrolase